MISVFGGTGFVGSEFCRQTQQPYLLIPRNDRQPQSSAVLYFISTTHNYHVFDDIHKDVDTNLTILLDVLKHVKKGDIFNFISSWFVYGDVPLPAKEDADCHPKGFYSITKKAAEDLLISYCQTFEINYRILRLSNVYGRGDQDVSPRKNALQYLVQQLRENAPIKLYYDGNFIRDYLHVRDAANAIDLAITKAPLNTILNIGSGKPQNFGELIWHAKKRLNSTSSISSTEPTPFHKIVQVKDFYMNADRIRKLGFEPQVSIETGINELCQ